MSDPDRPLSRRGFLGGGLVVLGAAVAPSALARLLTSDSADVSLAASDRLARLFADPDEVGLLGRAYLASRPDRPAARQLLIELLPPGTTERAVTASSDDELRGLMREWTAADLAAGRIEEVGGWLLSQTEVRLAALVTMRS